jgi:hypothetical protein
MLRDGDQEPDDLQQQENIFLVEFSAEYEDVGERRETAIYSSMKKTTITARSMVTCSLGMHLRTIEID